MFQSHPISVVLALAFLPQELWLTHPSFCLFSRLPSRYSRRWALLPHRHFRAETQLQRQHHASALFCSTICQRVRPALQPLATPLLEHLHSRAAASTTESVSDCCLKPLNLQFLPQLTVLLSSSCREYLTTGTASNVTCQSPILMTTRAWTAAMQMLRSSAEIALIVRKSPVILLRGDQNSPMRKLQTCSGRSTTTRSLPFSRR